MLLCVAVCRTSGGAVEVIAQATNRGSITTQVDGATALETELKAAVSHLAQTVGQPASRRGKPAVAAAAAVHCDQALAINVEHEDVHSGSCSCSFRHKNSIMSYPSPCSSSVLRCTSYS